MHSVLKVLFVAMIVLTGNQSFYTQAPAHADKKLTLRDVKEYLKTYFDPGTTAETREQLEEQLSSADQKILSPTLEGYFKKDEERHLALKLAIALKVSGLLKVVSKYIDGDDEDLIVELLFATQGKGVAEFLYGRWEKSASDSLSFSLIDDGFQHYSVEISDMLDKFKNVLSKAGDDEKRKDSALAILIFQMNLDPISAADLVKDWAVLKSSFMKFGKKFVFEGDDLSGLTEWQHLNATKKIGGNYLVPAGSAYILVMPDKYRVQNAALKFRLLPYDGSRGGGVEFIFATQQMTSTETFSISYDNGKWSMPSTDGELDIRAKENEWSEFELTLTSANNKGLPEETSITITINGEKLAGKNKTGIIPGPLYRLKFCGSNSELSETGGMAVGGVDFKFTGKE